MSGDNDKLANLWDYQTKADICNQSFDHMHIIMQLGLTHSRCCNAAGDRPYLVSGADDKLAKVWDYQTKACVQTLEGHSHNVSAVCFHPELPVILTGQNPLQPLLTCLSPALYPIVKAR